MILSQTMDGNHILQVEEGIDKTFYFIDKMATLENGGDLKKITEEEYLVEAPKIAKTVRESTPLYSRIKTLLDHNNRIGDTKVELERLRGFGVYLDKETLSIEIDIDGKLVPVSKDKLDGLKKTLSEVQKLKTSVTTKAGGFGLGNRVLLYGPTGTGKTFSFLATVNDLIKKKIVDEYTIVGITEGFEDVDFLAYIVPSEKGIKYTEKKIVQLLRDASKGKKVAILLDELNRGGKSFLNLMLKLLDAVDGENYVLNNFLKDEEIVIPIKNVMFFATMNLGGKYVGTSTLDEALFDRFDIVKYQGYDESVEKDIIKNFTGFEKDVEAIVNHVRECHVNGEIRAPISTRGIKMWAEKFINTSKSKDDIIETFNLTLLNRLTNVDDFGNPNKEEMALVLKKFKDLGYTIPKKL